MANTPKKVKDPTEVALSAIQEALNISDNSPGAETRGSARNDSAPEVTAPAPSFNEPSFDTRPSNDRPGFNPIEETRLTRRAANDDREAIGQALQALQRGRAGRNAYTIAIIASVVWVVAGGLLSWDLALYFPPVGAGTGRLHAGGAIKSQDLHGEGHQGDVCRCCRGGRSQGRTTRGH